MATFPANPALTQPYTLGRRSTQLLHRGFCLWHLTSLDAPTVAVTWAWAFAWAAGLRLAWWWLPAMALAVWAVYIGDRLLDAHGRRSPLQARHHFHWRHRKWFRVVAVASAVMAGGLVLGRIPVVSWRRDSVLGLATVAYFSGVHAQLKVPTWMRRLASREMVVGVIFTLGCALPVFSARSFNVRPVGMMPTLPWLLMFFSALAWLNVHSITCWEGPQEHRMRPTEIGYLLAGFGAVLAALSWQAHPRSALLMLTGILSFILLAVLDSLRSRIAPLTLRATADLVLLTPLLLIPALALVR